MTGPYFRAGVIGCAAVAALVGVGLAACGSSSGETPFTADAGGTSAPDATVADSGSTLIADTGPIQELDVALISADSGGGSSTPIPTTCTESLTRNSYIGCDYWPTVTLNPVWSGFDFAVAVSNPQSAAVHVTITGGALASPLAVTIPAGAVQAIPLPWVTALKGPDFDKNTVVGPSGTSRIVRGGAYHLQTDVPVSVYQFNALEYEIDAGADASACPGFASAGDHCFSYSNDASLLLPSNVATGDYGVLSWPSFGGTPGFLAVTATKDATHVTVFPAGQTQGVPDAGPPLLLRGDQATYTLDTGDVLELFSDTGDVLKAVYSSDLSGTIVHADEPVLAWGGHGCTFIPQTKKACDHLETSMFPVQTLGTQYVVPMPYTPHGEHQWVRVMALYENTSITFDPPSVGPANVILNTGDVLDLPDVSQSFTLVANGRVFVAQYMLGEYANVPDDAGAPTPDEGDPSESAGIPVQEYRSSYTFLAPQTYAENWIDVMAPAGSTVTLDGTDLPASAFAPVGAEPYSVASQKLTGTTGGHEIHGTAPFGLVVYGYGSRTSYMYPGGLDLRVVIIPPPPPPK
jgi:hypothetical protein